ncbi:hypothetical protein [Mesorhizobium sp. M5C.F.Ca.IN.020.32.2.1]|uniref:hypothetical protein n=1 Tax=Mesorhizobium sp. M5C.F.Ca.IN.020.32.2.1 TaxID=2496771 RepID=UPI000FD448B5|nr:hypothetical protein [Mesorhizobium sp. M5C.F.Ca.IN.020.32.2.1]RUV27879.1 hypothetical protein EOA86_22090 [Mesorhizobium sp. M5C.F.Ca.IN.020.32.2.1]
MADDSEEATPSNSPETQEPLFLTLRGVPQHDGPPAGEPAYVRDPQGAWRPLHGDRLYDIEAECVRLHDAFAAALFGDIDAYHKRLPHVPPFIWEAGLNSESTLSRDAFEQALVQHRQLPDLSRLLYLYDCRKLVAGIQECTKEVCFLVGEFYRSLNLDELFYPPIAEPDGVRWVTSPVVTSLTATLNVIYIRLHSLLDYTTKLVHEIEHLRADFSTYPKLSSSNILFGDRRRTGWGEAAGTLFEPGEPVTEIELVRNLVIHDGLLDDMPKVYKVLQDGRAIEKFVLIPDRTDGRLDRFKNRTLFYSRDDKINLRLPALILDFQTKQLVTLQRALARLLDVAKIRVTPPGG